MNLVTKEIAKELTMLFEELTGINFILANQDTPRPRGEYGTILASSSISSDGLDEFVETNIEDDPEERITSTIIGNRELSFSINIFRGDPMATMSKIYTGIIKNSSQTWMSERCLGFIERSGIRDITQAIKASMEPRAQMDLLLRTTETDSEVLETIANVKISVVAETSSGLQVKTEIEDITI